MPINVSRLMDALSTKQRREVLRLLESNEPVYEEALVDGGGDYAYHRLCTESLPHLEECQLVVWDRETGEICRGPYYESVLSYLHTTDDHFGP